MQETSLLEKIKISKELVSAVLGFKTEVNSITQITKHEIVLNYDSECGCCNESINLDTFVRLCKELAIKQGYIIESHTNRSCLSKNNYEYFSIAKIFKGTSSMRINTIEENTEIESTIQACEWLLQNADK